MSFSYHWFNDGHKILAVLDSDSVHPQVVCPGLEAGHRVDGLKCGMGTEESQLGGPENFCVVNEIVSDWGWEGNITGLKIMVRDLVPIEYTWEDESTMLWKVCGYPTWDQVKEFRAEALEALGVNTKGIKMPEEMFGLLPLRPWSEVDEETKEQLREDLELHVENETRRKEKNGRKKQT